MARGPHCGQYSIERRGSQEGIKKWEERERERKEGATRVYAWKGRE